MRNIPERTTPEAERGTDEPFLSVQKDQETGSNYGARVFQTFKGTK